MPPPSLNDYLGFEECVKEFAVKKLIPHLTVERFTVSILPWASWFDVECVNSDIFEPLSQFSCNELWTIVGADMLRDGHAKSKGNGWPP